MKGFNSLLVCNNRASKESAIELVIKARKRKARASVSVPEEGSDSQPTVAPSLPLGVGLAVCLDYQMTDSTTRLARLGMILRMLLHLSCGPTRRSVLPKVRFVRDTPLPFTKTHGTGALFLYKWDEETKTAVVYSSRIIATCRASPRVLGLSNGGDGLHEYLS